MGAVMSYSLGLAAGRPPPAGILGFSGFVPVVEGWEAGVLLTVVSQFVAENEGPYSIEIAIDGEHKKSVPFRVLPSGETSA